MIDIYDHRGGLIRHEIKSLLLNIFIQNTNNTFTVTKIISHMSQCLKKYN